MSKMITVTGGNGFIASHVIQQLLESPHQHQITATVRSFEKGSVITSFAGAAERLVLKEANLNDADSFDFAGQDVVLHLASPFTLTVKDNQKDLIDPAVNGTLAVLKAAKRAGSVKTVVVTSSLAAITESPQAGKVLDETMWNQDSSVSHNPYYYSKLVAEKAAWKFMDENPDCKFKLITLLPGFVIGPSHTSTINESVSTILNTINGGFPIRVNLWFPFVDVRDVARAHIAAFENSVASGRYILVGDKTLSMSETCDVILGKYPEYKDKVATFNAPNILPWLFSFAQPAGTASYLRANLSKVPGYQIRNNKAKAGLGIGFRPAEEAILATVEDLIKWKHV
ncbi:UNVERIFIED_CONTAM: hypothetical protein HDU68_011546 [Siphonaria sp. JEL0065]|nr:hypothetical protein HDU68_011546 [Siphonaria sp. JEL0065]